MSHFKMCEIGERVYMSDQLLIRVSRPFQELSALSRVQSFCVWAKKYDNQIILFTKTDDTLFSDSKGSGIRILPFSPYNKELSVAVKGGSVIRLLHRELGGGI